MSRKIINEQNTNFPQDLDIKNEDFSSLADLVVVIGGDGTLLEDTKEQSAVSIKETVHFMRLQRHPWMVEGNNQYNLAYMAITLLLKQILDEFH